MRWAQLTLVEDDPGQFDLPFWLDYFRRTHSDAVCLSAGGCVAYYPTEIPLPPPQPVAGRPRPVRRPGRGLPEARAWSSWRGPTRTRPTTTSLRRTPTGSPSTPQGRRRRHWASPEMWVTCALGPYNFDFMTAVHREIMTRYRVDGIFINRWAGSGMCYCEHCRTNFRAATGHELPRTDDPQDPARQAYILWQQQRLFELWGLWDAEVRKINPDSCVIPNTGGGATSPLDMKTIGELAPTLFADRQARSGLMPPWANGKAAKEYRATMGRKPVGGIFSMGVEEAYRWKDSVQSEAEVRIWFADGVANGLRPWFTKFCGRAPRPPLARRRRGPLPLAPAAPSATCGTRRPWPGSPWSTRSRRPGFTAARGPARRSRTTRWAGTRHSSRPGSPSRWSTTGSSTPTTWRGSRR